MSGEWVAWTPRVQLLTSPLEPLRVKQDTEEGSSEIGDYAGTIQEEELFKWSEYHPQHFRHQLVKHRLGPYLLSVVVGHQL